jgi:hypothetical protein
MVLMASNKPNTIPTRSLPESDGSSLPDHIKSLPLKQRILATAKWKKEHPVPDVVIPPQPSGPGWYFAGEWKQDLKEAEIERKRRSDVNKARLQARHEGVLGFNLFREKIHTTAALEEIDGRPFGQIVRAISEKYDCSIRNAEKFLADAVLCEMVEIEDTGQGRPSCYTLAAKGQRIRDTAKINWRKIEAANRRRSRKSPDAEWVRESWIQCA